MLEEFESDIRLLLAAGLKQLKNQVLSNDGELDEKSVKTLEVLNKCVSEIKKRETNVVNNPYIITESKDLEDAFQ